MCGEHLDTQDRRFTQRQLSDTKFQALWSDLLFDHCLGDSSSSGDEPGLVCYPSPDSERENLVVKMHQAAKNRRPQIRHLSCVLIAYSVTVHAYLALQQTAPLGYAVELF